MSPHKNSLPKFENQDDCKISLLDLPGWILDVILEFLPPSDLCRVAQVCTYLRNRSRSDDLWDKQVKQKWSNLIGDVALQEWQWHTTKINTQSILLLQNQSTGSCGSFSGVWPSLSLHSYLENFGDLTSLFQNCSKMALFVCLESGRFWFPAQVYKRVVPLCYDAVVSYDSKTDTFRARNNGWRMIDGNVEWDRLRSSPVENFSRKFYMSDMNDLKPGDHIEIQKRKRKEYPYDWWFAIIGHLESCNENVNHCLCQQSDMLVVEFKQYQHGSRWRRSVLNRNVYEEQGSRLCWMGGIRKLDKEEEIERWNSLLSSRNNLFHGQNA